MIMRSKCLAGSAILLVGGILMAPAAIAQTTTSQAAPQSTQQQPSATGKAAPPAMKPDTGPSPTDTELRHFVNAALAVQKIGKKVRPELKQAKTDTDRIKLQRQAEQKMKVAVRQHHLTVKRYQQIFVAMQSNKDIKRKVETLVRAKQGK